MIKYTQSLKFIIYFILSLIFSFFIVQISQEKSFWFSFWQFFKVPAMWPAFADIDHIMRSVQCKQAGFNPYINNPCDISGTLFQYPNLWLNIFEILNINNLDNFKILIFFSISLYIFCYFYILDLTKNYFNKFILFLIYFSSSSLLLIERGNADHIIFIFCVLTMFSKRYYFEAIIISLNSYLKIYPFFNFIYLFKKNFKLTLIISLLVLFSIFILSDSVSSYPIPNDSTNNIFVSLPQSFGALTIIEGFFKILEKKYYYNLDDQIKTKMRLIFVFIFLIISLILFLKGTNKNTYLQNEIPENYKKLFVIGASIYVGRYIFLGQYDYSLVFLIMTIPYISKLSKLHNYAYCVSLLLIFNSWFFNFTPLTLSHSIYSLILYSLKIIIFMYLSYFLGKICGNLFLGFKFNIKLKL